MGLVADLIYDDNNRLSPRLEDLQFKGEIKKELQAQFDDFFARLFRHHLWFYDFNDENFLVCTRKAKLRLYFVDTKSLNRNHSWSFLKLEYFIPALAKIRMKRRVQRFYKVHQLREPHFF